MEELGLIGDIIKQKRLALNLRMDDVAKQAGITRATLWSIEKGEGKCSLSSFIKVLDVLGISISLNNTSKTNDRVRASRANLSLDKKINEFVILCVEQYAYSTNKKSKQTYQRMKEQGIIKELVNDYEDLHAMSSVELNEYIGALLKDSYQIAQSDEHMLAKILIIKRVIELVSKKYRITLLEARDLLYESKTIDLIDDDETGLYGQSPLYVFSLFELEMKEKDN